MQTQSLSLSNASNHYSLPVKIDSFGRAWSGAVSVRCPMDLPAGKRGQLVFDTADVVLLLGPWGPDTSTHLLLPGSIGNIDEQNRINIGIGRDLPELTLAGRNEHSSFLNARQGQKVWLSIPYTALEFSI